MRKRNIERRLYLKFLRLQSAQGIELLQFRPEFARRRVCTSEGVLRFDRYLTANAQVIDLASGQPVQLRRASGPRLETPLFAQHRQHTLIDCEPSAAGRLEVWEPIVLRQALDAASGVVGEFVELLEAARLGAPRAFDLRHFPRDARAYLRRLLAREARVRGWVPVDLVLLLGRIGRGLPRLPSWLGARTLVLFADDLVTLNARQVLLQLLRHNARPHVLVREPGAEGGSLPVVLSPAASLARETPGAMGEREQSVQDEAQARWQCLLHARPRPVDRLHLAQVLMHRRQPFEARALAAMVPAGSVHAEVAATVIRELDEHAVRRTMRGWEMVEELVGVLQLTQDVEDEQTALAKVSAYLRERLQASSVAFVARDGPTPRVLTRVGSSIAGVELALQAIDTGLAVAPPRSEGPVESACPVRHATEVIGAVWCRWSAGMPVASAQAATLLGVAAAVSAPSLRLTLARLTSARTATNPVPELVGNSEAMVAVRDAIVRAAQSPFPVLIEGESGTGKELAARAIHSRSPRHARRFCAINCAALVDELVEAELFGHVRGAFTGATADRAGLFEEASGGTLFMDEIAELGARVQAKLLRVLQEGEVRRVGESNLRKTDVRIVAATNRPLAGEVVGGRFRADLRYRLDVLRIHLPPLRERLDDLPALVQHLWQGLATRVGTRAHLTPSALAAFAAYPWPGNIRELQNVLASMIVSAPRVGLVGPALLPAHIARVAASEREATLAVARRQFEQRYVRAALARAGGRVSEAARDLGVSRQGFNKLLSRLDIEGPSTCPPADLPAAKS